MMISSTAPLSKAAVSLGLVRSHDGTPLARVRHVTASLTVQAAHALALLFIALVLASAIRSAVAGLQRLGSSRTLAAMTAHFIVLALLVAVGLLVLSRLVDQTVELLEVLPERYESLLATFLPSFHWCIAGEETIDSLLSLLPAGRR